MSGQAGRYQRSAGGMVGALSVLVVLVLAWVGLRALTSVEPATVRTVDYAQAVAPARKAADFDLVAPSRLPTGWRATTVRFDNRRQPHWHLGVLTDEGRYVGLEQGNESTRSMLEAYVDEAATRGRDVDVAGRPWRTYSDPGGDRALLRRTGETTTLVVGSDVSQAELVSYAATLR